VAQSPTPTRVLLSDARAMAGSIGNGYALRADGTVLAWGRNDSGQLGGGWRFGESPVPAKVLGLTGVTAIASSDARAYALRADGTVWSWGGDVTLPVQVPGLTNVTAIAGGYDNGYAIQDGTVWAWGDNAYGQLGLGTNAPYSAAPVQVSTLTGFTAVADGMSTSALALRADGTVWAWGSNGTGLLGNGQPCPPNQACVFQNPAQVSGLTGVTSIAGSANNAYAVRDDGTVWAWGASADGRLGDGVECGTCPLRLVPGQVVDIADATQVASFYYGGLVLRADGTVSAWGENEFGVLGNDSVDHSTVPVAVPGLTGIGAVAGSYGAAYAHRPAS